jgi:hypothetical protein
LIAWFVLSVFRFASILRPDYLLVVLNLFFHYLLLVSTVYLPCAVGFTALHSAVMFVGFSFALFSRGSQAGLLTVSLFEEAPPASWPLAQTLSSQLIALRRITDVLTVTFTFSRSFIVCRAG